VTVLRPAGIAEIGGRRLDVVTRGEFLPEGAALRVESAEGSRVVVSAAEDAT
jgi:membrane-bound serine protease (ClpP class)